IAGKRRLIDQNSIILTIGHVDVAGWVGRNAARAVETGDLFIGNGIGCAGGSINQDPVVKLIYQIEVLLGIDRHAARILEAILKRGACSQRAKCAVCSHAAAEWLVEVQYALI